VKSKRRDEPLFAADAPRHPAGRVRRGLDSEVADATGAGVTLAVSLVAVARSLADQLDQLERQLRSPASGPYDRVPLAQLSREYRETYDQLFAAVARAEDPLTHALATFLATDDGGPPPGHPEESHPAQ